MIIKNKKLLDRAWKSRCEAIKKAVKQWKEAQSIYKRDQATGEIFFSRGDAIWGKADRGWYESVEELLEGRSFVINWSDFIPDKGPECVVDCGLFRLEYRP